MSARSTTSTDHEIDHESGESQLRLLPGGFGGSRSARPDWQLDERTRSVGLLGGAQAREVLRQARPPEPKRPEPVRKAS